MAVRVLKFMINLDRVAGYDSSFDKLGHESVRRIEFLPGKPRHLKIIEKSAGPSAEEMLAQLKLFQQTSPPPVVIPEVKQRSSKNLEEKNKIREMLEKLAETKEIRDLLIAAAHAERKGLKHPIISFAYK